MKIIDRYLLRSFVVPWFYAFTAFLVLIIIFDLFDNLEHFIQADTPILQVFQFYLFILPSVLPIITPLSILLAILYALSHLTKNNEMTAMRASGVSLYRLVIPFVGVGVLASVIVFSVNETIGPWSAYWTEQFVRQEKRKGTAELVHMAYNLPVKNEVDRRIWVIGEFNTRNFEMKNVEIVQQREDGFDDYKIQAQMGDWLDGRWWLTEVAIQRYDKNGHPKGRPELKPRMELHEFSETPKTFVNEFKPPEFLSSLELHHFLRTHAHLSHDTQARYLTDLHYRLALPWVAFIVTMLGIPFGTHTGRKGAFVGVALSILLFFGYYFLITVGVYLGKSEVLAPWLAGWLPNILFLALGVVLMHRMR